MMEDDKETEDHFVEQLDSLLRVVIEVVPERWITSDSSKQDRMVWGELSPEEVGPQPSPDSEVYARRAPSGGWTQKSGRGWAELRHATMRR